ncbi:MAG: TOBE domain-containing protein [Rhizobacter sp.]|nr:TOBE domain-containing protein [Rhizobacter sp.]
MPTNRKPKTAAPLAREARPPARRPAQPAARLRGRLSLDAPGGALVGERRVRLLEAIAEHGSITRAAAAVPLSYKAAWDALEAMNNLSPRPLVERSTGGRQGGGTRLTDAGRELIAMYRAVEREQQVSLDRLGSLAPARRRAARGAGAPNVADAQAIQSLLRRMAVRTSARNQFVGTVARLSAGKLGVEVTLELDAQTQIVAGVTRGSADALGLRLGAAVMAIVKAPSVLLAIGDVQTSARNHLTGTVGRIVKGPISAEVTLVLPAGRSVTAGITRASLDRLGLARGVKASALFKASSVILVALD